MAEFTMPSLGADMEEGTLLEWLVKPGDAVKRGQVIAVVGTEKGDIEIEVWEDGTVAELLVAEGVEAAVGSPLARIDGAADAVAAPAEKTAAPEPVTAEEPALEMAGAGAVAPVRNGHRVRVSPLARRLAEELGVDLNTVNGTGPHGAISKADIEAAAASPAPATKAVPAVAEPARDGPPKSKQKAKTTKGDDAFQKSMRQAIATAMARANRDIPHYYLETRIDMQPALTWLEAENQQRSIRERVLPVVLLIKAVALGLAKIPALNGYWIDDEFHAAEGIHIGFAIALRQGGLITPAIHHADLKPMDELMETVRDLIMRTRAGRLRGSELTDATVTLTSLGDMGVEKVFGVIYPPQVALVGFGKIREDVWVEKGMIGVRPILHATLAGDHRASDGRTGAEFLDVLEKLLREPAKLWE